MEPAIIVGLLWLLFGGTHVGLATRRVRGRLVDVVGEGGFFALFSLVAALTFWMPQSSSISRSVLSSWFISFE